MTEDVQEAVVQAMLDAAESGNEDLVSAIAELAQEEDLSLELETEKVIKMMDQKRVIAVDFNRTLAQGGGPDDFGEPTPGAKEAMQRLRDEGLTVCINSVVGDVDKLKDWLDEHEIPYDHINESPAQPEDSSHKLNAAGYIDDRAVPFRGDWDETLEDLFSSGVLTKSASSDEIKRLFDERDKAEKEWNAARDKYSKLYNARVTDIRLEMAKHDVDNAYEILRRAGVKYNEAKYGKSKSIRVVCVKEVKPKVMADQGLSQLHLALMDVRDSRVEDTGLAYWEVVVPEDSIDEAKRAIQRRYGPVESILENSLYVRKKSVQKADEIWRELVHADPTARAFIQGLMAIGVDDESAMEYADDPNALPRNLRNRLNEYVRSRMEFRQQFEKSVSRQALEQADFITLPASVQGTNCMNCQYEEGGKCGHPKLTGLEVTERDCCAYWDNPGATREWREKGWSHPRRKRLNVKKTLRKGSPTAEHDDDDRTITWIMTTGTTDRDGETVDPTGGDFSEYRLNRAVQWNHDTDDFPIGRLTGDPWVEPIGKDTKYEYSANGEPLGEKRMALLGKVKFSQENEDGDKAYRMAKEGMLGGGSISFLPKGRTEKNGDGGNHYPEWKLLEFTICALGSNPDSVALAKRFKAASISVEFAPVDSELIIRDATKAGLSARVTRTDENGNDTVLITGNEKKVWRFFDDHGYARRDVNVKGLQVKANKDPAEVATEAVKQNAGGHNFAPLTAVRQTMASMGISGKGQQDQALFAAWRAGKIGGHAAEGRHGFSPAEQAAMLDHQGEQIGYFSAKSFKSNKSPFDVIYVKEHDKWYVQDNHVAVGGPFRSEREADKFADDLWREQQQGADRAEKAIATYHGGRWWVTDRYGRDVSYATQAEAEAAAEQESGANPISHMRSLDDEDAALAMSIPEEKGATMVRRKLWVSKDKAWLLKSEGAIDDETQEYLEQRGLDDVRVEEEEPQKSEIGSEEWKEEEMAEPEHQEKAGSAYNSGLKVGEATANRIPNDSDYEEEVDYEAPSDSEWEDQSPFEESPQHTAEFVRGCKDGYKRVMSRRSKKLKSGPPGYRALKEIMDFVEEKTREIEKKEVLDFAQKVKLAGETAMSRGYKDIGDMEPEDITTDVGSLNKAEEKFKDAMGDCVSNKIAKLVGDEGYEQDQAAAIAYNMCGEKAKGLGARAALVKKVRSHVLKRWRKAPRDTAWREDFALGAQAARNGYSRLLPHGFSGSRREAWLEGYDSVKKSKGPGIDVVNGDPTGGLGDDMMTHEMSKQLDDGMTEDEVKAKAAEDGADMDEVEMTLKRLKKAVMPEIKQRKDGKWYIVDSDNDEDLKGPFDSMQQARVALREYNRTENRSVQQKRMSKTDREEMMEHAKDIEDAADRVGGIIGEGLRSRAARIKEKAEEPTEPEPIDNDELGALAEEMERSKNALAKTLYYATGVKVGDN